MNLREGTRRLALLVGLLGAIACGVLSYAQLQTDLQQRADHQRFERLANSSVVEEARKACFGPSGEAPWVKYQTFCSSPSYDAQEFDYTPPESNNAGIKAVHFEKRKLDSIDTQDGQRLYQMEAPGPWSYVLIAIFPVFGFFIPWIAVRSIGWVLAGFIQPSN